MTRIGHVFKEFGSNSSVTVVWEEQQHGVADVHAYYDQFVRVFGQQDEWTNPSPTTSDGDPVLAFFGVRLIRLKEIGAVDYQPLYGEARQYRLDEALAAALVSQQF